MDTFIYFLFFCIHNTTQFFNSSLASTLFHRLAAHPDAVTGLDRAGETALGSLVHNPRCLASLSQLAKSSYPPPPPVPDRQKESEGESAGKKHARTDYK